MGTLLPRKGEAVEVSDPSGYSGRGEVVETQTSPHHAVLVRMTSITDRLSQSTIGREVWLLAPHVKVVPDAAQ